MADWFKFYENDLDETRFQYAIHQLSEVCPVWVGILSECCRHKSDTIRWGSNEIELFGFSQRLNVSVPKVNEAIKLLVDIDYISRGENTLKVLKWNTKQSDYCSRIKRSSPNTVRTLSEQCSPRGEESRVEEKKHSSGNGQQELLRVGASAPECEMIYKAYPRRVNKPGALKAIAKAINKYGFERVMNASQKIGELWKLEPCLKYCPHPSTWFNQERFLEEPETWKPNTEPIAKPNPRNNGMSEGLVAKQSAAAVAMVAKMNGRQS